MNRRELLRYTIRNHSHPRAVGAGIRPVRVVEEIVRRHLPP
jgi:hypothetical protein